MIRKSIYLLSLLLLTFSHYPGAQPLDMDLFHGMQPRNIGPAGMSGRVTAIDVVRDDPRRIYIGTASGGLWHSDNGGLSWSTIFENEEASSVGAVAINQNNPTTIWIGTGEGNPRNSLSSGYGMYKSIDGGKSWRHLGLENTRNIHRVMLHPDNPDVAWVAAIGDPWSEHPERGVYKTTDGGKTWEKVLFVNEKTGCADLVIDPSNPNKLIAAMWEHRRWPWFFNSGGPGSGLYVSYDGGETWQQRTAEDGLPEGELGRIGLAIAPSRPEVVYALVESKKNGLYKSTDGGQSWKLVATKGIGGRPFYYADIFVDTKNENRVFNLHTYVDVSQDGGKTFEHLIDPNLIHVDNHAFYIHPDDPDFLICGNDGGLCLSRDGGDTWDFSENLPLAQFYHIRVDDQVPYNVYGGLQDNGTWRGPSRVWRRKGIRNMYWNRIGFGDGFDAAPDPRDPRHGYALSQGGNLLRYDLETGNLFAIKPFLEGGEELRFNWNAALAIDPFDRQTVYLGAQYVLRSRDKGDSWERISPDLTTDYEAKQNDRTGGLTLDATGAETHTSLITIEPSPVQEGVIWTGSDDGKVHLTRDGGDNWTDLSANIRDVPDSSWVAQVQASPHNAGEAFAVINNYRRGDWTPYLYHTTDYGQSWQHLTDGDQVWGYGLSVVQDTEVPELLFLGTEFGLYVSIDKGKNWTKWTQGYPTVSTMDMALQPRMSDLVIGTFGRAVWILDDIRPLRELARQGAEAVFNQPLKVFPTPDAYLANLGEPNGYRSTGDGLFVGENREPGALISYYIRETMTDTAEKKKPPKAVIEVFNAQRELIRTLNAEPKKGINRITWELDVRGVRYPDTPKPKEESAERGGRNVVPGDYLVRISYGDAADSTTVTVLPDPKLQMSLEDMVAKAELIDRHYETVRSVTGKVDRLREVKETLGSLKKLLKGQEGADPVLAQADTLQQAIDDIFTGILPDEDIRGIFRNDDLLDRILSNTDRYLQTVFFPRTTTQAHRVAYAEKQAKPVMERIDRFFSDDWAAFRQMVEDSGVSLVKGY